MTTARLKFFGPGADPFGYGTPSVGVSTEHADTRRRRTVEQLGQTLTLFGMGLAVVLIGLLMGLGL